MKIQYKEKWFKANVKHFDEWFTPECVVTEHTGLFAKYCDKHFDKWFDPKTFNWGALEYLEEYCHKHFDKWFDKDRIDWEWDSYYLAKYCSKHLLTWFDPLTFNWNNKRILEIHSVKHSKIWKAGYQQHLLNQKMKEHLHEN
jgi:hypothetical protein